MDKHHFQTVNPVSFKTINCSDSSLNFPGQYFKQATQVSITIFILQRKLLRYYTSFTRFTNVFLAFTLWTKNQLPTKLPELHSNDASQHKTSTNVKVQSEQEQCADRSDYFKRPMSHFSSFQHISSGLEIGWPRHIILKIKIPPYSQKLLV